MRPRSREVFETGRWFTPQVTCSGQVAVRSDAYSVPFCLPRPGALPSLPSLTGTLASTISSFCPVRNAA